MSRTDSQTGRCHCQQVENHIRNLKTRIDKLLSDGVNDYRVKGSRSIDDMNVASADTRAPFSEGEEL